MSFTSANGLVVFGLIGIKEDLLPFHFVIQRCVEGKLRVPTMAPVVAELSERALRNHESLPASSRKPGKPRLDPREAFRRTFYERLLLLEMLQWRLGRLELDPAPASGNTIHTHPWRAFLDQLAWVCDYTNGGDSTSGIAVQNTPDGPRYWLAANFDPKQKGISHLEVILRKLATLQLVPSRSHRAIFDEILLESLVFSTEKFENYRRVLLTKISMVKQSGLDVEDSAGK
jgi:hypothetical protein